MNHFCNWIPALAEIDELKAEGRWNNDWEASLELIRRHSLITNNGKNIPSFENVIQIFHSFYFGGDPNGTSKDWHGLIKNETLLVNQDFFQQLTLQGFRWGFISGAEAPSIKYILEARLGLSNPPVIAMGEAPDKPDPTGLLRMANQLNEGPLGKNVPAISYLGDTVADVLTIQEARTQVPEQRFISLAIAPPHLHKAGDEIARIKYENQLKEKGADKILKCITDVLTLENDWPDF